MPVSCSSICLSLEKKKKRNKQNISVDTTKNINHNLVEVCNYTINEVLQN